MTSTGSTSNGVLQYWENMVHRVASTIFAFARSVAVHSMKMSRVSRVICSAISCVRRCIEQASGAIVAPAYEQTSITHLAVRAVNDRRQAQDGSVGIKHDWVHQRLVNDGHEALQLQVMLEIVLRQETDSALFAGFQITDQGAGS